MKLNHGILPAMAMLATIVCSPAQAAPGTCSNATLKGAWGFEAHGQVLGILDSSGIVHPFTTPQMLDDVAILNFDGAGRFTRTDFGMIAGKPKGGQTAFNPDQNGYYTVNADCTGTMKIVYTGAGTGVVLELVMVVSDSGTLVNAIITSEIVPGAAPTVDNTSCGTSCAEGVQVALTGKKVQTWPAP